MAELALGWHPRKPDDCTRQGIGAQIRYRIESVARSRTSRRLGVRTTGRRPSSL